MKFILLLLFLNLSDYQKNDSISIGSPVKFPEYSLSTLPVHPFGIFISRIEHNLQSMPLSKPTVSFNISSGNVWLPKAIGYLPLESETIDKMKSMLWHHREFYFDPSISPAQRLELHADGVVRSYRLNYSTSITNKTQLGLTIRVFSLDKGKPPVSVLTSDQFIEWFHSNIAGGEDPFGRKHYGFNKALIFYKDPKGKELKLTTGDFEMSGIEATYTYFPLSDILNKRKISLNFGTQLGVNTTGVNSSVDIGLTASAIKKAMLPNNSCLNLGISLATLRQRVIKFNKGVELSNNEFLHSTELLLDYQKRLSNGGFLTLATTYYAQSAFNQSSQYDYFVNTGERVVSHWHYTLSHLYRTLSAHNLSISYSQKGKSVSAYLREDLDVDNAPDLQVGLEFKIGLKN